MRRVTVICVVLLGAVIAGGGGAQAGDPCDPGTGQGCVLAPPSGERIYHAAFPDFGGAENQVKGAKIHRFERLAGRRMTWAYFSNNWFRGEIRFPASDVEHVLDAGRLPFIRLMARSGFGRGADPNFSMDSIAGGDWDADLRDWCDGAAAVESPLLAEFGTEVNGDWFPWNGRWNGGGGDSDHNGQPDGPEAFIAAYHHIVDICRGRGANNITWFFHVDVGSWPQTSWNQPWKYYPGDSYVDWIGLSDYGPLKPGEHWSRFRARMDRVYGDLTDHLGTDRPLAVLEYGAAEDFGHPARKANWIQAAIHGVAVGRWPAIRGLSYWHEAWHNGNGSLSDLHIDSTTRSQRAYRQGVAGPPFASSPEFGSR